MRVSPIYCPTARGGEGGTEYQRGRRRKPSDGQTSDTRLAVCLATYPLLMAGGMVPGRFLDSARNDNRAAEWPGFRGFKRFKGFRGEGIAYGDEYEASVTGFASASQVVHDEEQKPPSLGRSPAEDF